MAAAEDGYGEIVEALLDAGQVVDAKDENGETALMKTMGCRLSKFLGQDHEKIADLLINKGQDVNTVSAVSRETPLMRASDRGYTWGKTGTRGEICRNFNSHTFLSHYFPQGI